MSKALALLDIIMWQNKGSLLPETNPLNRFPLLLSGFEIEPYLEISEIMEEWHDKSHLFRLVENRFYLQFLHDLSPRLMRLVCRLTPERIKNRQQEGFSLWHEIGREIIRYVDALSADWFYGASGLHENFAAWFPDNLEPSPGKDILMTQCEHTASDYRACPPPWFSIQGGKRRKQVDEAARWRRPAETKVERKKREDQRKEQRQSVSDWRQRWVGEVTEERIARQADPLKAYDGLDGPVRVCKEMVEGLAGLVPQRLVHNLTGADKPVQIKIPRLANEMEHTDQVAQIVLDYSAVLNIQYTICYLGQIPTNQYNFLPQSPTFWFRCNEITAQRAGMTSRQATVYALHNLETAIQMVGMDIAESSVPTILHPCIGDQAVELKEGEQDPVALWVRLSERYPDFRLEKWMRRAFKCMLPFTASDANFRLASMEERIPVVKLLEDSADLREEEPYTRLQWMFFCFFGVDAMELKHMRNTHEALRWAIIDINVNGHGPASFQYLSEIRVAPEAHQAQTI